MGVCVCVCICVCMFIYMCVSIVCSLKTLKYNKEYFLPPTGVTYPPWQTCPAAKKANHEWLKSSFL